MTTDFVFDQGRGVAIQPNGRIVAAGISSQFPTGVDFALARYNPDGTLDTTHVQLGREGDQRLRVRL